MGDILNVAAIDPVECFLKVLIDLNEVTDVFVQNDAIPHQEYLRAIESARDQIDAICSVAFQSVTAAARQKIDPDVWQAHAEDVRDRRLAMSPEEVNARIQKIMGNLAQTFTVDTDQIPGADS